MQPDDLFSNWLRERRRALDLTQEELARLVGCAAVTIKKLETGTRRPSKPLAERLAAMLGIEPSQQVAFVAFARGLSSNPPAMPTLREVAQGLPLQPTPFVGRNQELLRIRQLLDDPTCRLLTLVGPGGIGKTRLALQAAEQMTTAFVHGIYFVSLAPLSAPDSIILALAEAIGFAFYPDREPKQQLLDYLRARDCLLLLDNFEHLLSAVGLVTEILATAPRVKILTTTRERLNLQAERVFPVDELAYPLDESIKDMAEYPAVQLFVQCVARVQPDVLIQAADLDAVARICRQVQGMPLGILLAAAWVGVLSVQEIAQEIQHSLNFLETDQRDMPERQRSLRAAFNHSWKLLTDEEREVFRKVSVFRGGFTRDAVAQITGASLKVLMALVNKSLLRRDPSSGRFLVHELLRQYAEAQLAASPQENARIHALHCAYYGEYMRQQWAALMSLRQGAVLSEIGLEFNNIRVAWDNAVEHGRADVMRAMARVLWYFCMFRAPYTEARVLFTRAAEALQRDPGEPQSEIGRGLLLTALAMFTQGRVIDPATVKPIVEQGLVLLRKHICPEETVFGFVNLASLVGFTMQQFTEGEYAAQEGLRIAQECGNQWGIGWCLTSLSYCVGSRGDLAQARKIAQEAFRIAEATGDVWMLAVNAVFVLGRIVLEQGDYPEAERYFEKGLRWYKELERPWGARVANASLYLGKVALLTQDHGRAKFWLQQSLNYHQQAGRRDREYAEALYDMSRLFAAQSKYEDAVEIFALLQCLQYETPDQVYIRDLASASLADLHTRLPDKVYLAALERGKALELDTVVANILAS